ncbi:MAG TPA: TIGR03560 family F420-dependent LLM class oxidoreductase [Acidimicrobiia bacterium]|nr:TIGR03560 family F420-dependent LLM class oxidoreductase [Acidimicrobiia bacterium]
MDEVRIPVPSLVVLAGPSGAGKSAWAEEWFRPDQVVSSDRLRSLVGEGEHDQAAGDAAFDLMERVLDHRMARKLLTVIDTLGMSAERRSLWRERARAAGMPALVVAFDTSAAVCRARNRNRSEPVPDRVLASQVRRWPAELESIGSESWDGVLAPGPVRLVLPGFGMSYEAAGRQADDPRPLRFGLQISRFAWEGGTATLAERLAALAVAAEQAGFDGLWLMDHLLQIPQVGRVWEDLPESTTTLGFLAAATTRVGLGTLVTPVTFRAPALLGKTIATLDVLSGGRARLGLGLGWWEREHLAFGLPFPSVPDRYMLLEDTIRLLRALWSPGSRPFNGKTLSLPETGCYPRPLQERLPIIVGGSGERRTLRVVAELADGCNLMGDPEKVAAKVSALARHCEDVGRPPEEVEVTHLSTALVGRGRLEVDGLVDRLRPPRGSPQRYAAAVNAGTVDDHVGRFRRLAESGVGTAIVSMPDLPDVGAVERFAPVIGAFA